jgi:hypothetical protein
MQGTSSTYGTLRWTRPRGIGCFPKVGGATWTWVPLDAPTTTPRPGQRPSSAKSAHCRSTVQRSAVIDKPVPWWVCVWTRRKRRSWCAATTTCATALAMAAALDGADQQLCRGVHTSVCALQDDWPGVRNTPGSPSDSLQRRDFSQAFRAIAPTRRRYIRTPSPARWRRRSDALWPVANSASRAVAVVTLLADGYLRVTGSAVRVAAGMRRQLLKAAVQVVGDGWV